MPVISLQDNAAIPGAEHLSLRHLRQLRLLLDELVRPFSEYSLANLYLFRGQHDYRLVGAPSPYLLGVTYDGEQYALPLTDLDEALLESMLDRADCIYPLERRQAEALQRKGLCFYWNDDDSDYLYRAVDLATLKGARKKLAQARRFELETAPRLESITDGNVANVKLVLAGWLADVGRREDETDYRNCIEALDTREQLGLSGVLARTEGGEPVGFLLSGEDRCGGVIVHFAKGRRKFDGVYPWMFSRFAATAGNCLINFEQDLGNPGFARSKKALAPLAKLVKYRVRRK